jgi:hypothetical protein
MKRRTVPKGCRERRSQKSSAEAATGWERPVRAGKNEEMADEALSPRVLAVLPAAGSKKGDRTY